MRYIDLLFPGGREPASPSDWLVLIITSLFALFMCIFLLLLALTAVAGVIAVFEQIVNANL